MAQLEARRPGEEGVQVDSMLVVSSRPDEREEKGVIQHPFILVDPRTDTTPAAFVSSSSSVNHEKHQIVPVLRCLIGEYL